MKQFIIAFVLFLISSSALAEDLATKFEATCERVQSEMDLRLPARYARGLTWAASRIYSDLSRENPEKYALLAARFQGKYDGVRFIRTRLLSASDKRRRGKKREELQNKCRKLGRLSVEAYSAVVIGANVLRDSFFHETHHETHQEYLWVYLGCRETLSASPRQSRDALAATTSCYFWNPSKVK